MYVFDTSSIIAFLNGEKGAETVRRLVNDVESGSAEGVISPVVVTEVYCFYLQNNGKEVADELLRQLRVSKLRIIPAGEEVAVKAGAYKAMKMPIADAYMAATAKILHAKLVADDRHFVDLDIDLFKFR